MKFYLAGPMTGIPQFNYPAFHEAAKTLRAKGLEIISPAEVDTPEQQEVAMASSNGDLSKFESATKTTWGDILAKDVKIVADEVDGVVTLTDWNKSKGARLEVMCANVLKKPVYEYNNGKLKLMDQMVMNLGLIGFPLTAKLHTEV